jgi:phage terminase large subunit
MEALVSPADQILAPKVRDLFFDADGNWIPSDYKVMHGGRGGLKSWGFARVAVLLASMPNPLRIACAREYQTSIEESVHQTICRQISALNLDQYFDVGKYAINSWSGSKFFFAGIRTDPARFKSTEGIDILYIEEGEKVTEDSWEKVSPTIRKAGSEIWCAFNPDLPTDATSKRFIGAERILEPYARVVQTNWRDNPWLSDRTIRDKDYLARVDPDAYHHVWEGGFRRNSAAQVLKGKYSVEAFEAPTDGSWSGPHYGVDWGFSVDPTAMVRMWVDTKARKMYVDYEAYGVGVELDNLPAMFDKIPGGRAHISRADNARPETINHLNRHGYPRMKAGAKWTGCVEDGVEHFRSYEKIVIHPRCEHTIEEALLWSYKVDKTSGDVLAELADKHNHCWDAARYGLEPMIKRRTAKVTELRI